MGIPFSLGATRLSSETLFKQSFKTLPNEGIESQIWGKGQESCTQKEIPCRHKNNCFILPATSRLSPIPTPPTPHHDHPGRQQWNHCIGVCGGRGEGLTHCGLASCLSGIITMPIPGGGDDELPSRSSGSWLCLHAGITQSLFKSWCLGPTTRW